MRGGPSRGWPKKERFDQAVRAFGAPCSKPCTGPGGARRDGGPRLLLAHPQGPLGVGRRAVGIPGPPPTPTNGYCRRSAPRERALWLKRHGKRPLIQVWLPDRRMLGGATAASPPASVRAAASEALQLRGVTSLRPTDDIRRRRLPPGVEIQICRQALSDPTRWTESPPQARSAGSLTACLPAWVSVSRRHGNRHAVVTAASAKPTPSPGQEARRRCHSSVPVRGPARARECATSRVARDIDIGRGLARFMDAPRVSSALICHSSGAHDQTASSAPTPVGSKATPAPCPKRTTSAVTGIGYPRWTTGSAPFVAVLHDHDLVGIAKGADDRSRIKFFLVQTVVDNAGRAAYTVEEGPQRPSSVAPSRRSTWSAPSRRLKGPVIHTPCIGSLVMASQ